MSKRVTGVSLVTSWPPPLPEPDELEPPQADRRAAKPIVRTESWIFILSLPSNGWFDVVNVFSEPRFLLLWSESRFGKSLDSVAKLSRYCTNVAICDFLVMDLDAFLGLV